MTSKTRVKDIAKFGWFAARLRRLMSEQNLRARDLADRMGGNRSSTQTNISGWVRALGMPGPRYRAKLAKALGVPTEDLYRPSEQALAVVPEKRSKALAVIPPHANGHDDVLAVTVKQGVAELRLHAHVPVAELDRVIFGLRQLGVVR